MKIKITFISLVFSVVFWGCDSFCVSIGPINAVFIGYEQSDIDTFILRRYTPNNNFQHLKDTLLISSIPAPGDSYGNGRYNIAGDTTFTSIQGNSNENAITGIIEGYDWQIYIPAKNQTVTFSGIVEGKQTGAKFCLNPINSFQQDGLTISSPTSYPDDGVSPFGYRAFIRP